MKVTIDNNGKIVEIQTINSNIDFPAELCGQYLNKYKFVNNQWIIDSLWLHAQKIVGDNEEMINILYFYFENNLELKEKSKESILQFLDKQNKIQEKRKTNFFLPNN